MKILILGANGLLGTSVSNYLSLKKNLEVIRSSRTTGECVDASSFESLLDLVEKKSPDVIINLVALTNVDDCEKEPYQAYKLNALVCKNLSKINNNRKIRVIHISTDHLYNDGNSSEDDIHPLNYYAFSKLLGESFLEGTALILRTNFFGKGVSSKQSFSDWIFNELSSGKSINLFQDSFFSPLNIDSICEVIFYLLKNYKTGTFNVGSNGGMSKYEFGMKFAKQCNLNTDLINKSSMSAVGLLAKRPIDMRMNISKFEKCFEYNLPSLEDLIVTEAKKYTGVIS